MRKILKWQKKLAVEDILHLKNWAGITSKESAEKTFAAQKKMREKNNYNPILEPCWECRKIAEKLGYPV
jgi:hypothetical protein